ncbi:hypothetical protein [Peptoniphilus sp. oral taxon 386]|uniref:hypothetical protein n=1 Tax=Peptoniphilus sp. oral taxon 386 TaxID=652713 RepID=UPI0001DAA473|nr:hypothetical protein [Peptoniphilus sp. oral taxon 386]EFI41356.1 hypothetical protein HMPREF0629_01414 [Peptoniphilus sp. oral taxon 386 str. F0131]
MNVFKRKENREKSIYDEILDFEESGQKGSICLNSYFVEKSSDFSIDELKTALLDYYERENKAVEKFCNYFQYHRAEDIIRKFENYIFSMEVFNEQKLVGMSILLMRDTRSIEAMKFGIMLSEFYSLENVRAAIKIITDLGAYEEFTEISLKALKQVNFYPVLRDNIQRRGNEKVKEIVRNME